MPTYVRSQKIQQGSYGFSLQLEFALDGLADAAVNAPGDTWKVVIIKPSGARLEVTAGLEFPDNDSKIIAVPILVNYLDEEGVYAFQVIKTTGGAHLNTNPGTFEVFASIQDGTPVTPSEFFASGSIPVWDAVGAFTSSPLIVNGAGEIEAFAPNKFKIDATGRAWLGADKYVLESEVQDPVINLTAPLTDGQGVRLKDGKIVNVKEIEIRLDADYGVVVNSSTSQHAKLQQALDYLKTKNGGTIVFPEGETLLAGDVFCNMNGFQGAIKFKGSGSNSVVHFKRTGSVGCNIAIQIANTSKLTVEGLTFIGTNDYDGSSIPSSDPSFWDLGQAGFHTNEVEQVAFVDCKFIGIAISAPYDEPPNGYALNREHGIIVCKNGDLIVERCYFGGCATTQCANVSVYLHNRLTIRDTQFIDYGYFKGQGIGISKTQVTNSAWVRALYANPLVGARQASKVTLHNVKFDEAHSQGLFMYNGGEFLEVNNLSVNNGLGHSIACYNTDRVTVVDSAFNYINSGTIAVYLQHGSANNCTAEFKSVRVGQSGQAGENSRYIYLDSGVKWARFTECRLLGGPAAANGIINNGTATVIIEDPKDNAFYLARANHTGTQAAATISDFSTAADARIAAQKGAASGLATLDGSQKITASQLPTSDGINEGSANLYHTSARVRATLLAGLSLATGGAIADTDSILVAAGKLQKQITDLIPSQTGNNGKFITTNGTVLSWATVDALPAQTGNSGKFLTTNGTVASWGTPPLTAAGAATQVQFNTGGLLSASAKMTFASNTLTVGEAGVDTNFRLGGAGWSMYKFDNTKIASLGIDAALATGVEITSDGTHIALTPTAGGTKMLKVTTAGVIIGGANSDAPGARLHSLATTTQLRLAYSTTVYSNFTVDSAGSMVVQPQSAAATVLSARGASSHTGDLFRAELSNGTAVFRVTPSVAYFMLRSDGVYGAIYGDAGGQMYITGAAGQRIIFSNALQIDGGMVFQTAFQTLNFNGAAMTNAGSYGTTTSSPAATYNLYNDYNAGQAHNNQGYIHRFNNDAVGNANWAAFQSLNWNDATDVRILLSCRGFGFLKCMKADAVVWKLTAAASQTGAFLECRSSTNTLLASITAAGGMTATKFTASGAAATTGLDLATADNYAEMRVIRNSLFASDKDMYLQMGAGATSALKMYSNNSEALRLEGGVVKVIRQLAFARATPGDAATITVDWNNGNIQAVTIAAVGRTIAFSNPVASAGCEYWLFIKQDATGSRTVTTWPATILWEGGTVPVLTATANKTDIFRFFWDGTNYFGSAVKNF